MVVKRIGNFERCKQFSSARMLNSTKMLQNNVNYRACAISIFTRLKTRIMIAAKLKEDAGHLQDGDSQRLVKSYIIKVYAHSNEVIITGGVNLDGCGGGI